MDRTWLLGALAAALVGCGDGGATRAARAGVDTVEVEHPAMGFTSRVGTDAVALDALDGTGWHAELHAVTLRCGARRIPIDPGVPAAARGRANRVQLARRAARTAVVEWYEPRRLGLEQGFTVERACDDRAHALAFEIELRGLTARPRTAGGAELVDAGGTTRLAYTDLAARDATGRALPVALEITPAALELRVDTSQAVFPVEVDPLLWTQQAKLVADDGVAGDWLGGSVAISGDTAIAGALTAKVGNNDYQGAAYVFVRSGAGAWTQQQKLVAPDGTGGEECGFAVALDGDTAVVGCYYTTVTAGVYNQGSARVFVRSGTTWTQQQKLVAGDAATQDFFGSAVAVSGESVLVGATYADIGASPDQGAAYVFTRTGTTWTEQKKLVAPDGAAGEYFGGAVAIDGATAVVGAPAHMVATHAKQGAAYVFARTGTTWTGQQELTATNGAAMDRFGSTVSVSGTTALVGAAATNSQQGAAYAFARSGTSWTQQQKLVASDAITGSFFGHSVALDQDTAIIGDASDTGTTHAYAFARTGVTWSELQKLAASDGAALDGFASAVSVSGKTGLVGANAANVGANAKQGAAYVFQLGLIAGDACAADADCGGGHCVDGFCCDSACDGACDVCSAAKGASADGTCSVLPAASPGEPACAPMTCNGTSPDCAACIDDSECPPGHYCAADGSCQAQKAQGSTCSVNAGQDCHQSGCAVCGTGQCVDGVCCDAACSGACEACTAALTGSPDGTCAPATATTDPDDDCGPCALCDGAGACAPVAAGTDPRDRCAADPGYPGSCGADGRCDGQGNCRSVAPQGVACGSATCGGGQASGKLCNGAGSCVTDVLSCGLFQCDAAGQGCLQACTTASDCTAGAFCDNGACSDKKTAGQLCSAAVECGTGYCADGVCCDSACTGQCEACDGAPDPGACAPVDGAPHPGHSACAGTGGDCGGVCDGVNRASCSYPGADQACGTPSCSAGVAEAAACDGKGKCSAPGSTQCAPYVCAATSCADSCNAATDCTAGYTCDATTRSCIPTPSGKCSADLQQALDADGNVVKDCAPYLCTNGQCGESCSKSNDCGSGYVCETASQTCAAPSGDAGAGDSGGCGCRAAGAGDSTGTPLLLALGVLALAFRRRRSS